MGVAPYEVVDSSDSSVHKPMEGSNSTKQMLL